MRFTSCIIVALVFAWIATSSAADPQSAVAITFDRAVHFLGADGTAVQLGPGIYRVEPAGESQLRLVTQGGQPIQIAATKTSHNETLFGPIAMGVIEEGQDDTLHVVLLLPDGVALDATGSYSGVRSRAAVLSTLKPAQLQTAMSQVKLPQPAPPQPAPQQTMPAAAIVRVPQASVGSASVRVKTPSTVKLGSGKWISWTYLQVNHPELVAQALADVQAGKRPLTSLAGLATPTELNEMLKTNWAAEVARLNAAKQATVTTRGLPAVVTASPSVLARPLLPLPVQDLGATYTGEHHSRTFSVTAAADGYLTAELDLKTTDLRFRIDKAVAYTGEFVNGVAQIYRASLGGDFLDVRGKNTSDPTKVSMAGYVTLDVRAGQHVEVTVAFEPHASIGPPVGSYEATLQLSWHRPDTTVLAYQTVPLRAYCNGIHFGLIAYAEQAYAITLTDRSVDYPVVLTNAGATPVAGAFSAPQLPPGVTMNPLSVNIAPNATQHVTLRFNVNSQSTQDGPNQDIAVAFNYGGGTRPINLSISIYHPWIWWCDSMGEGVCGQTPGAPGVDLGSVSGQYIQGTAWVRQVQVWIKTDGQWWWKIDAFNSKTVDVGGTDFKAVLAFAANPLVTDTINVHIGPVTYHQYYEHLTVHPWVSSNFLTAAQTGVTLEKQD